MSLLVKNATIASPNAEGLESYRGHIYINHGIIEAIYPNNAGMPDTDEVIDASGYLVIPGLINAHLHSDENLFKGLLDNLPLELWMLYSYPPLHYGPLSTRLIYLRTLLGAIEMVKHGVTSVQDDVSDWPVPSADRVQWVLQAYADIGLRANVGANSSDKPYPDKIPYLKELLPPELLEEFPKAIPFEDLMDTVKTLSDSWHGYDDRIQYFVSPSAPQRCTTEFLLRLGEYADDHDLRFHTHVLETRTQRVTGQVQYGQSLIAYLADLGLLSQRTTIIHSVWVSRDDMELMSRYGANVAHNPVSNLKLGSGIMPFRALREAGVNIALGSDGMSSNDSQNMFEALKFTALLHKITNPDYEKWPTAEEVLTVMWQGGARSLGLSNQIGKIAKGFRADLVLLNLNSTALTPLNSIANHLVYCENGRSVDTVIVNGKIVVKHGVLMTIDEQSVLGELKNLVQEFYLRYKKETKPWSDKLLPYLSQVYRRICGEDIDGMERWLRYDFSHLKDPSAM
ncbi:amidohydrolase family protein [Sulfobacillus thermosulfidooxidans]|uniref:amidohydrolase family protein n=1 Tax=Sulfobacillus thermosulfidooxidans TaxID=28034 RepID=UPI00041EE737|nr:amidohydrolase [Sulfobacillus thermosulfidooxidans]